MISAAVLAGEGWTVGAMAVGGATVDNRVGVFRGNRSVVGAGVAVRAAGSVLVGDGFGVSDGSRVSVGGDVIVSNDPGVFVSVGVQDAPGSSCWGLLVGCSAGTGGGTIKTPTFSMATPAFLKVILTNL